MRKYKYDNLKGILILLVVIGHLLITYDYFPNDNYNVIINGIYLFHMPLFFIISGYFSKNNNKKNIIKYILLFFFMNSLYALFDYFRYGSINIFSINYSSWFILLLAIYRMIIYNKKISNLFLKKYSIIIIFIISITSGFFFKNIFLVRLFSFFYFFIFGYRSKFSINKKYNYSLLIISITLLIIILFLNPSLKFLMFSAYDNYFQSIIRMFISLADIFLFISLNGIIKDKKIPIITSMGENTLYIYIFHRIPALIITYYLYPYNNYILYALVISILLCIIINYISKYLKKLLQYKILIPISFICFIIPLILYNYNHELTIEMQSKLDDSISIGFVGDLILLENQLILSNNNFDYLFNNINNEIQDTDYVFGVLEGPVNDNNSYSYGNFSDNKELRLNYPTSFLEAIEKNGIDMVTIANNHILDRGVESYKNTINNLNNSDLDYIGTKNNYKIINIKGIKVGVLAYTYGLNYLDNNDYLEYTNFLTEPYSNDYEKIKRNIHNDFQKLKESKVDFIIVMPHYGTQFSHQIDSYQEVWNRFFIKEGANIILGDHSHAIQPIEYKKNSIIINSPGNYINSYIDYDGDISMYVKIFINKNNYKIIGSAITPIIATIDKDGKYYPELLTNTSKKNQKRVANLFSEVIFNNQIKEINNTYYYLPNDSYKYDNKYKLELNDNDKNSLVFKKIEEHNKICFIGDSITEGTKNNYNPWYLPLMNYFSKEVVNISKGSYTSYDILNNFSDKIKDEKCDLNIINIGTNDIRYNKENVNDYINNIHKIINLTSGEVIILAPWQTTSRDYNIAKNDKEKRNLYYIYNEELKKIKDIYYIDPNPFIKEVINYNGEKQYLIDGIHPNNKIGIKLYSFSVLRNNLIKT